MYQSPVGGQQCDVDDRAARRARRTGRTQSWRPASRAVARRRRRCRRP